METEIQKLERQLAELKAAAVMAALPEAPAGFRAEKFAGGAYFARGPWTVAPSGARWKAKRDCTYLDGALVMLDGVGNTPQAAVDHARSIMTQMLAELAQ